MFWTVAIGTSTVLLLRVGKNFRGKERIRPVRLRSRLEVGTDEAELGAKALYLLLCEYNDDDK